MIGGYGAPDSVLSWMTPGEGVVTPQAMRRIGGEAGLNTINASGHMAGGMGGGTFELTGPVVLQLQSGEVLARQTMRASLRRVALA